MREVRSLKFTSTRTRDGEISWRPGWRGDPARRTAVIEQHWHELCLSIVYSMLVGKEYSRISILMIDV